MIVHFCDVTGEKIVGQPQIIEVKKHVVEMSEGNFMNGYVDKEGNRTSGVAVSFEVSQAIYNRVMLAAMNEIIKIKEELNND